MIAALILAGTAAGADGALEGTVLSPRLGCFVDAAATAAGLSPLIDDCRAESREERRFWLVGPRGAVYLLRLLAPTIDRPLDGDLLAFGHQRWVRDEHSPRAGVFCETLGYDVLHEVRKLDEPDELDWRAVADRIDAWRTIDAQAYGLGRRSFLSLVVEACIGGVHDAEFIETVLWQPERQEHAAIAVRGLILSLDRGAAPDGWNEDPLREAP